MKKLFAIAAAVVMCLSFAACGRRNNAPTTAPSTAAPTTRATMPSTMMPTIETNIPDPDVDPYATDGTDHTNPSTQNSILNEIK